MPGVSEQAFRGHTAVIAHGASGVGLAIARRLAAEGADIVLLDADPDIGAVASRLRSDLGMPAMGARGDLADAAFISTAFRAAVEHLDFPDLLVLAAPHGAEVMLAAFRSRLEAAGKAGVCVSLVAGGDHGEEKDGVITRCRVDASAPDVPEAVVSAWRRVGPSSSA